MRTRILINTYKTGRWRTVFNNGSYGAWASYPMSYRFKGMVDEVHPNWRKLIRTGNVVIGYLRYWDYEDSSPQGGYASGTWNGTGTPPSYTSWYGEGDCRSSFIASVKSGFSVNPYDPASDVAYCSSVAKEKAIANVDKPDFDFMEDLLSMRQNIRMLRDPLEGLSDAWKQAKRKHGARAGASLWTYYRFAATPFVLSLSNILESLVKPGQDLASGILIRSGGRESRSGSSSDSIDLENYNPLRVSRNWSVEASAGVFYKLRRPSLGLSKKYGIRLKDLPAGLWAVMPYSFMIDRVTNVTRLTNALANLADPNISFMGGYVSTKVLTTSAFQAVPYSKYDPISKWTDTGGGGVVMMTRKSGSRDYFSPSIQSLSAPVDFRGLVKDASSIVDLASLTLQRVKR